MHRKILATVAAALSAVALALTAPGPAHAAPLPVVWNFPIGFLPNIASFRNPPPGALEVDWRADAPAPACSSAIHPQPVLLLHGTWENQSNNWQALAPFLRNNGYCVYTTNYGGDADAVLQGTYTVPESAREISVVVDRILAATGQPKLAIIGHSQGGGITPRYYLKFFGGNARVDRLIGLAPSNHGTTISGLATLGEAVGILDPVKLIAPGAMDQAVGSAVNRQLDAGGDTVPGVAYTVIINHGDQVITPYTNAFLTAGPGATVDNIELSRRCPLNLAEHLSVPYDSYVGELVLNALSPRTAKEPVCRLTLPLIGG
ncbi:putative acetyltransferase/hydrolase with alpha/beta hydrolase fold [Frankia sp. EI5c]|uniref:esterase/lipase family protein n=1 Tax=Frankia sp. EI5c TaxID=683316 RepID=UPI0007C389F6|nr:alpha/beta fold hydrolase [Frankia sp. EI5c]OAA23274.1 putative acetyltransferase/hydrolase with alpha/beta hydrolase fold [Frankia sp. EI5c]